MNFYNKEANRVYDIKELMFSQENEAWCKCFYDTCRMHLSVLVNVNTHTRPEEWDLINIFENLFKDAIITFEKYLLVNGYDEFYEYEDGKPIVEYDLEHIGPTLLLYPLEHLLEYITEDYYKTMGISGLSEYHIKEDD